MSNHVIHAVHHFETLDQITFDPKSYSYLKFGCNETARKFGNQLAETFFQEHSDHLLTHNCVVIPSPYNYVENAATNMTRYFVNRLNELLVESNGEHVEYITIQRKVSYISDYGFLSKEKRQSLISNDKFFVPRKFLKNKTLIFIDDIRITGTHEEKLQELMVKERLNNDCFFLYFGLYEGFEPDIEAKLNFAAVSGVGDYIKFINNHDVRLLVRPIKYILSNGPEAIDALIDVSSDHLIEEFYHACINEGYYKIPSYQDAFTRLRNWRNEWRD